MPTTVFAAGHFGEGEHAVNDGEFEDARARADRVSVQSSVGEVFDGRQRASKDSDLAVAGPRIRQTGRELMERDEFGRYVAFGGDTCRRGHARDLLADGRCRQCLRENSAKYKAQNREKHLAGARERARTYGRWRKFGLTKEQYLVLAAKHGGMCGICNEEELGGKQLAIDHDHVTGKVRGLLCQKCNTALGYMRDSPELLRTAAVYLEYYA